MVRHCRLFLCLFALVGSTRSASAQSFSLGEVGKPGDSFTCRLDLTLKGTMKIVREGKTVPMDFAAEGAHVFAEKVLDATKGIPVRVVRKYTTAKNTTLHGTEKSVRVLSPERSLVVARRNNDGLLCFSPAGPLTRAELELTAEHFDTMMLAGLLPGKDVSVGDVWKIDTAVVAALCQFDGLISHDLTGKLTEVKDGSALFAVEGKASGIEVGGMVRSAIRVAGKYDLLANRIVALEWKQNDSRDQGPATPATELESTVTLRRTYLTEEPKDLSRSALAAVSTDEDPAPALKLLSYRDDKGRYRFLYPRDWHIVARTENHLVLRLLERGDFIAQATIVPWKTLAPGTKTADDDFRKAIAETPGWVREEEVEAGTIPSEPDRTIFRITARGDLDGVRVVQTFCLITDKNGRQVVVTFTMKPAQVGRIGTRDVGLLNAIDFGDK